MSDVFAALSPEAPARKEWPEITDAWADTYCELTGRAPDGQQVTFVDAGVATTFRDVAKREIEAMLCAAPKPAAPSADDLREALIQADLKIRSFPGADQSDVAFIREVLDARAAR